MSSLARLFDEFARIGVKDSMLCHDVACVCLACAFFAVQVWSLKKSACIWGGICFYSLLFFLNVLASRMFEPAPNEISQIDIETHTNEKLGIRLTGEYYPRIIYLNPEGTASKSGKLRWVMSYYASINMLLQVTMRLLKY